MKYPKLKAPRADLLGVKITGDWDTGKKCSIASASGKPGGSTDMHDVKTCAEVCKSHWFEPETMRFFRSRVGQTAYADAWGGAYFVSSEKPPHGSRAYSVRRYDPKRCGIDTVGEFLGYRTSAAATKAAQRLARSNSPSQLSGARKKRKARR